MKVDFKQLPADGNQFESMVCELFRAMGYPILEPPAVGADGGRDFLVERIIRDPISDTRTRIVVQCKHHAHSGRSVNEGNLGVWTNTFIRFQAQGYLLVTSSTVTENLNRVFIEFTRNESPKFATFWDADRLRLLLGEHPDVRDCFFPPLTPKVSRHLGKYGWAAVFPSSPEGQRLREALRPLLDLRKLQVENSAGPGIFREFSGKDGVSPNEAAFSWLARHNVGPGMPSPEKVPFFVMLIGGPEEISFEFQAELGVQYYVGRIHFESMSGCEKYVRALVEIEVRDQAVPLKNVALIAPEFDEVTRMSSDMLVRRLSQELQLSHSDWSFSEVMGESAGRDQIIPFFTGVNSAALIFAATHGVQLPLDHRQQRQRQGALVTSSWHGAQPSEENTISASDLDSSATPEQRIIFLLGCFGAGTALTDEYQKIQRGTDKQLANRPFVSALAQKLLSRGSSAIIGHVGRAWTTSFSWHEAGPQPQTFLAVLCSLMDGQPVGVAVQALSRRYAELASIVASIETDPSRVESTSAQELLSLKTAMLDAKYFLVLGDPAARLRMGE